MQNLKIKSTFIFKYQLKTLLRDKSFIVMSLISFFLTIAWSIVIIFVKTADLKLTLFNYYVLINVFVVIILNVYKMIGFFFSQKRDDKTLNIIVTQELKRSNLFSITLLLILAINAALFIFNFSILNLTSFLSSLKVDLVFLRITAIYLAYSIIIVFFLEVFIAFLLFVSSMQITTILVTLLMSFSFISSLPYKFLMTSEHAKSVTFINPITQQPTLQKVDDMYDALNLHKQVNEKKIAYPNLSDYILNNFINHEFRIDKFEKEENVLERVNIWDELGILNKSDPVELKIEGKISSVRYDVAELKNWAYDDDVEISTNLENTFITLEQLDSLIENQGDNQKILKELRAFTNEISDYFKNFQAEFYNLFDDFIFLQDCTGQPGCDPDYKTGYIYNDTQKLRVPFQASYLRDIYQSAFVNLSGLALQTEGIQPVVEKQMSEGGLFNPLMLSIRILENYFIKYTSNYILATTYTIVTNSKDYIDYKDSRNVYNLFFHVNFVSNVLINYVHYSGFSYQDIWFNPDSRSKISFTDQENLFFPYVIYDFKIEDNKIAGDSYKNYLPVFIYLLVQLIFALILYSASHYKFKNMDLN